jgi:hypothetical protein
VTLEAKPDDLPGPPVSASASGSRRPPLLAWLWPVPAGLLIGAYALDEFARSPGDPSGHVIGAGLGGTFGLAVALVIRACYRP